MMQDKEKNFIILKSLILQYVLDILVVVPYLFNIL